jgi:hypothetical protein
MDRVQNTLALTSKSNLAGSIDGKTMTEDEWKTALVAASANPPRILRAHTYLRTRFSSISRPALMACTEGIECVVKKNEPFLNRAMANDQVIGRIGNSSRAPVATVELVDVPKELIDSQAEIKDFSPGITHGSHFMADISKKREPILHIHVAANRSRFAQLSLLYGLAYCQHDHQFFYQNGTHLVFSLDHGHLFPNGPNWTPAMLKAMGPAVPDNTIHTGCSLTNAELTAARDLLERVSDQVLAAAVASIPSSWNVTDSERIALVSYLEKRRGELLSNLVN